MPIQAKSIILSVLLWTVFGYNPVTAGVLWDKVDAHCSFVNKNEIGVNATKNVLCIEAISELLPLVNSLEESNDRVVELSRELGSTEAMLKSVWTILGENNVPPQKRAERLVEKIVGLKETIASLRQAPSSGKEFLDHRRQLAADAIENGMLKDADALLAEIEEKEEKLELNEALLAAAVTKAHRGRIAKIELRYVDAAKHYSAAAAKTPRTEQAIYLNYLHQEASAFLQHGEEFEVNTSLEKAIALRKQLIKLYVRERAPLA